MVFKLIGVISPSSKPNTLKWPHLISWVMLCSLWSPNSSTSLLSRYVEWYYPTSCLCREYCWSEILVILYFFVRTFIAAATMKVSQPPDSYGQLFQRVHSSSYCPIGPTVQPSYSMICEFFFLIPLNDCSNPYYAHDLGCSLSMLGSCYM